MADNAHPEPMADLARIFGTLGSLFLVGLGTDLLGRTTALPRVTLLLVFGFIIGPGALNILPDLHHDWFPLVANVALLMVGFLLGGKLTAATLRRHGREVVAMSVVVALTTAALVATGLILVGAPLPVALLLGGIAPATAPAATSDVIDECNADGPFSRVLLGIVALDDAWGLIIFSISLAAAQFSVGGHAAAAPLLHACWDVFGAVVLGLVLGGPMAFLTGRVSAGKPTLTEALGFVLLCGGIAIYLEVSFLIAAMVMGAVVTNVATHHSRPFHAIEGIEWPFIVLFFVLGGASLEPAALVGTGLVGVSYIGLRIAGRLIGCSIGGWLGEAAPVHRRWMGLALMPQAGIALGLALIATQRLEGMRETLLPIVIGATVFFELIGPVLTRRALIAVGEARLPRAPAEDDGAGVGPGDQG